MAVHAEPGIPLDHFPRRRVGMCRKCLEEAYGASGWLRVVNPLPPPQFFVSSQAVSRLFATLAGRPISVAAEGLKAIVDSDPDRVGGRSVDSGQWGESSGPELEKGRRASMVRGHPPFRKLWSTALSGKVPDRIGAGGRGRTGRTNWGRPENGSGILRG